MSTQEEPQDSKRIAAEALCKTVMSTPPGFGHISMRRAGQGGTLLVVSNEDIPLYQSGYEHCRKIGILGQCASVNFMVIGVLSDGYSMVPYKRVKDTTKVSEGAQKLCELAPSKLGKGMNELVCYAYTIVDGKPMDKGPRVPDTMFVVAPGMLLSNSFTKDSAKDTSMNSKHKKPDLYPNLPLTKIPAFTVLEVDVVCKGWSRWIKDDKDEDGDLRDLSAYVKGYGLGIQKVRFANGSMYSYMNMAERGIPQCPVYCQKLQRTAVRRYAGIRNIVQQRQSMFLIKTLSKDAFWHYEEPIGMLRLMQWNPSLGEQQQEQENDPAVLTRDRCDASSLCSDTPEDTDGVSVPYDCPPLADLMDHIDVRVQDAMRMTNTTTAEEAWRLLDLCCSKPGSLSILCEYNRFRPGKERLLSVLHGIPIIRTAVLLQGLSQHGNGDTLATMTHDDQYITYDAGLSVMGDDDVHNGMEVRNKVLVRLSTCVHHKDGRLPKPSSEHSITVDPQDSGAMGTASGSAWADAMVCGCEDLPLMSETFQPAVMLHTHALQFLMERDSGVVWSGFFNYGRMPMVQSLVSAELECNGEQAAQGGIPPKRKSWAALNDRPNAAVATESPSGAPQASSGVEQVRIKKKRHAPLPAAAAVSPPPSSSP